MSDLPIKPFKSAEEFEKWLEKNHDSEPGIWLRFYKKASGKSTVVYAEAVDVALCYGWIDSQMKKYDEISYIQKFTPRGPKSMWSRVNRDKVTRLIEEGRMKRPGLLAVTAAQSDGRWEKAYHSQSTFEMDKDFTKALNQNPKALKFYNSLTKANQYALYFRLHHTRKEKREEKIREFVAMLDEGKAIHLI